YLIGTVSQITNDPATGFYLLKVKTAVNFSTLQQVFVVENLMREEQLKLAADTEKKLEQQKKGQR
ncbi:MAG TPA: rod shape-determining protein MreC, partial [Flavisolibacter sp.]